MAPSPMAARSAGGRRSSSFDAAAPAARANGNAGAAANGDNNNNNTGYNTDHHQHAPRHAQKPLTLLPLVALIFFEVSGGPFGTEDAVAAAGPLLTLLGFLILPLVWSIPEALVTAEMATAFPENSGYVALVTAAFGPFAGFLEGFFSWLSGVADNSVYPVLLADNLAVAWPALGAAGTEGAVPWVRMAFVLGTALLLTLLSFRGLQVVGNTAAATTALVVVPFALLCALALPRADPRQWLECDWPAVQWGTYLNVMFWNLNYWDSVSCLAGEVSDPARTFPRALLCAVVLVVAMYFLPTLAALGLPKGMAPPSEAWALGDYGRVALAVPGGGKWLAGWVLVAAAASQVGQFQAEMASDAYQLQGMAERGFLPIALARRSRYGTPTWGIAFSCVGIAALGSFSFVGIISALNAVYALAELLEFAAFVWLRYRAPALPRPYRVPLSTFGVALMLAPASALLLAILALPVYERNWATMAAGAGAVVVGCALYPLLQLAKARGWMAFADLRFEFEHHVDAGGGREEGGTPRSAEGGAAASAAAAAKKGRRAAAAAGGGGGGDLERGEREPLLSPASAGEVEDEEAAMVAPPAISRATMLSPVIPESPGGPMMPPPPRRGGGEDEARGGSGALAGESSAAAAAAEEASAGRAAPRRSGSWSIRAAGEHPHWEGGDEYATARVDSVDFDGRRRTTTTPAAAAAFLGRRRSGEAAMLRRPSASSSALPGHEEAEEEGQEGEEEAVSAPPPRPPSPPASSAAPPAAAASAAGGKAAGGRSKQQQRRKR